MRSSIWKGALVSLAVHTGLLLALVLASGGQSPLAATAAAKSSAGLRSAEKGDSPLTRVALLGRASSVRVVSPAPAVAAPVAPIVMRHRGPVPKQPRSVDPEVEGGDAVAAGADQAAEVAPTSPVATAGASEDGDGLAGVLAHSASALAGDPRAPAAAESGAREAIEQKRAPDLSRLNARLQAAAARCYPDSARRFRQAGVAHLEFCLDARGALTRSAVQRSSGVDALDDAATGCVLPNALPAGPEVGAGCFTLPVRFGGAR